MTYVHSSDCDELRVILCLEFDPRAQPETVAAFKNSVIESPNTLHSVEVTGDYDFMTEIAAPDLAWFSAWWKTLANLASEVIKRCEKAFVCRRFVRRPRDENGLWVRSGDELKRIDHALVDKVVAEGDYARVHSKGQSWLLHATMHSLFERLRSQQFIQLHRSLIVRCSFIDRLNREDDHWMVRLRDGTTSRVAKSHVAEALRMTHSPPEQSDSSNRSRVVERQRARLTKI